MFVPGSVCVFLEGASWSGLLQCWAEERGYQLSDNEYSDIMWVVGIPEGKEDEVVAELLKCDWVAAASREEKS